MIYRLNAIIHHTKSIQEALRSEDLRYDQIVTMFVIIVISKLCHKTHQSIHIIYIFWGTAI